MSDIAKVAHVLRNYPSFRRKPGSRGGGMAHPGLRLLRSVDLDRVAERILRRSWHNRKVASSMFKMAESVEVLLHLQLNWMERYALGRLLISSLTYAGLYRLVREEGGNATSPYFIVATGESLSVDNAPPRKTRTDHPFPRWTSNHDDDGNRLVKPSNPSPPELEYNPVIPRTYDEGFLPWLEAVHGLESVPFRINEEFLDLVKELDANPETRIVQPIPPDYEKRRKALDRKHKAQGLEPIEDKFREDQPLTAEEDRKRRAWWKEHYLLEEQKREFKSRRAKFENDLEMAGKLRGKRFFHRLKMCHRGRIYYPEFSYQGSDFARAVIEFDEGVGITDSGWEHLFIHTANVFGESDDVAVKLQKGEGSTGDYLAIGLDPAGQFDRWSIADKPYCFLRSCLEITDGLAVTFQGPESKEELRGYSKEEKRQVNQATERWEKTGRGAVIEGVIHFPSHMPVELDQSNSAFQHIALMMNDKELQEKANMGTIWSDLYTEVARSERMNRDGLTKGKEKRKIIKLVAVPWSYGGHNRTCADDLLKFRQESPQLATYLSRLTIREINLLADDVVALLEDEFETCVRYRERVEQAVEAVHAADQSEVVGWVTPFMFPMVQRKHTFRNIQRDVWSGEGDVEPQVREPRGIDWRKNKTSAPANLVHSVDASLIHTVVCYGRLLPSRHESDGVLWEELPRPEEIIMYPLITVHDAFACHASNAADLKGKLVSGLAVMYKHFDPLRAFLAQTEGGEFDPRNRDIDWAKTAQNVFS